MESFILQFDQRLAYFLFVSRDLGLIKFFSWVTLLGSSEVIIFFLIITAVIFWLHKNSLSIYGLFISVVCAEAFTYLGKNWFERPRPEMAYYLEHSYSFPSGHATAAIAFYGFVAYYLYSKAKNNRSKNIILFLAMVMMLAIGFSRLYLGVHYLTDVLAGYLVGLFWLVISISFMKWLQCRNSYYKLPQFSALEPYGRKLTTILILVGILGFVAIGFMSN